MNLTDLTPIVMERVSNKITRRVWSGVEIKVRDKIDIKLNLQLLYRKGTLKIQDEIWIEVSDKITNELLKNISYD
jgi:hypothetical protein